MTKDQIKTFEELLNSKDFKGKKSLKHLLWLNTSTPKFKIGECFKVSDSGHRVFDFPVKDFKAKIIEIKSWITEERWYYTLEACVEHNGKQIKVNIHKSEDELWTSKNCEDNINILK